MLDQTDISRPTATRSQVTPPDPVSVRQAEWVNDIHSGLNATRVSRVEQPDATTRLQTTIKKARVERKTISIAAGKGAMGGQQFGTDSILFDMNNLNQVVSFDPGAGLITVSPGIQWPQLIGFLSQAQVGQQSQWGIKQKQTGDDRLSIGGTLAANAHGRGLDFTPIVGDIESFTLVDANAQLHNCSRDENP